MEVMPVMYDEIVTHDTGIEYGIIKGSNKVLYIKVGNGGSIYGYNNKYLEIATDANEEVGCTVVVASNPINIREFDNIKSDMTFIDTYMNYDIKEIYAFGHSNGGVILSNYSFEYELIKRVLIINAPLNINWHKIKEGLSNSQAKVTCLYGTNDPSYKYIELLKAIKNIEIVEVEKADHNFSDHYNEFRNATIEYLLKEV